MNTEKELYNDYDIRKSAIAQGKQELSFEVLPAFFKNIFEENEFAGEFKVEVKIDRNNHVYNFDFNFEGKYTGNCNRCLSPLELKADFNESIVIKETDYPEGENTDEIIYTDSKEEIINIAQLIYEFCKVHFPMRFVHTNEEDCDAEVMNKLSNAAGENDQNDNDEIDPRWAELSKLKS